MKELVPMTLKEIPGELYREFKAVCARQGMTIKDKVIELMKKEIEPKKEKE